MPTQRAPESAEREEMMRRLLSRYGHLDFVRRLLMPELYPVLSAPGNPGVSMSHQMAAEYLGPKEQQPAMFPTIVYDRRKKRLQQLELEEAKRRAWMSGEYIPFGSIDEAIRASTDYKAVWPGFKRP